MKNSFQGPWRKIWTAVDHYRNTISLVYNKSEPLPLNPTLLWIILDFFAVLCKIFQKGTILFSVRLLSSPMARSWQGGRCGIVIGLRDGYRRGTGGIYNVNSFGLFHESAFRLLILSHRVCLLLCNVIRVYEIPLDARCEKWPVKYRGSGVGSFVMDLSHRCLINLPLL